MSNHAHDESSFLYHEACPSCQSDGGDSSGNNLARYSDGHGYCHACKYYEHAEGTEAGKESGKKKKAKTAPGLLPPGDYAPLKARGIREDTCRKFGYSVGFSDNGDKIQIAPFYNGVGVLVAQHTRDKDKNFRCYGNMKEALLFGQNLWKPGGRRLIITEGEIDALTISQLQDNKWPVVSIKNGAGGAAKDIKNSLEWVDSFQEVVLAFDMDEPGRKAAADCAMLLSPGKARIASLPRKDANECLQAGLVKELISALWEAVPFRPDGIVNGQSLKERCKKPPKRGVSLPYRELDEKLLGIRERELYLFTAGSGIGKSTIVNEVAYHLHQKHNWPVGIMALEESIEKTGRRYTGIHLSKPLNLPGFEIAESEFDTAFDQTVGRGDWWIYDHFGSTDIDGLLAKLRYLVVGCGVKCLVLDHISIVVSGLDEIAESERKTLDRLMTRLRSLVEETGVCLLAVVHLKRPEKGKSWNEGRNVGLTDLRGSASLEQLSDVVVALERDQQGDNPNVANVRVLKNRPVGLCGPAGAVEYVHETGRLIPYEGQDEYSSPFEDETKSSEKDF